MRACILLYAVSLLACSAAPPTNRATTDPQQTTSQLDSLDGRLNRWIVAGQVDSIISVYYAPDATLLVAGSSPIRGSSAIRAVYEGFYKLGMVRGQINRTSLIAADSVATDIGRYEMQIKDKADSTKVLATDRGSYLTAFVRRDGRWQAIYDANVSEMPPAPPPTKK